MSGRRTGSKNRPGHSAGGSRPGAGRKSKEEADRIEAEKRRKAQQEAKRKADDRAKRARDDDRKRKQREVRRARIEKQTTSRLRRSARLQQQHDQDILCRQDEYGDDGDDDDNDDDDDLDEDGDDESDDEEDYATEEGGDDATKERRKRRSNKYMPPPESPLGQHLDEFQGKIAGISTGKKIARSKKEMWYGPGDDPAASASIIRSVWLPVMQFSNVVSWAGLGCPFGCGNPSMESKGLIWRPMFNFGDIVWVLHQRVHCKNCRKKCSSIHISPINIFLLLTVLTYFQSFQLW